MKKQVLFIHGGGDDGYNTDAAMAASLKAALGNDYEVSYPQMLDDESAPDLGWLQQIGTAINNIQGEVILVGHSLGASLLLKYLSETKTSKKLSGIFLLAPPFWQGDKDWVQGLKLQPDFAGKLPENVPIFLYQSREDEVVPFEHFTMYTQKLRQATFLEFSKGDHQFNNDLEFVAREIEKL